MRRGWPALLLMAGCVAPPDDDPVTFAEEPVSIRSEDGRAVARVTLEGDVIVRGENDFRVELVPTSAGASAELVGASAFMPAHGHGSGVDPKLESGGGEGVFWVRDLVLFMPGRWDVRFDIEVGGAADDVVFPVDVP